jgi:hypothetical protein
VLRRPIETTALDMALAVALARWSGLTSFRGLLKNSYSIWSTSVFAPRDVRKKRVLTRNLPAIRILKLAA